MPYSDDGVLLRWFCILEIAYNRWDDTDLPGLRVRDELSNKSSGNTLYTK